MICPKCGAEQEEKNLECMRCGVIFAKLTQEDYAQSQSRSSTPQSSKSFGLPVVDLSGVISVRPEPSDIISSYRSSAK